MIKLITDDYQELEVKQFVFNDGSVNVEIQGTLPEVSPRVLICAELRTPADQMALVLVRNAIENACMEPIVALYMPFCPYGRQDAVFVPGQANAMKAWAEVINSLDFSTVMVRDPHSIAVSHIDRLNVVTSEDILYSLSDSALFEFFNDNSLVLVSPDAGANKKAHKICQTLGINTLIRADKARDLATGNIIETEVYGDVTGKHCFIADDICDGGMTFIKLAEKLREKGASKVTLYVTHGLFTKGLSVFEGLIDTIYTTDSWTQPEGITDGYTGTFEVLRSE